MSGKIFPPFSSLYRSSRIHPDPAGLLHAGGNAFVRPLDRASTDFGYYAARHVPAAHRPSYA